LEAADEAGPESPIFAALISSTVMAALGEERARELRARGADMDWDQTLAYTLTQTSQALSELKSATRHEPTAAVNRPGVSGGSSGLTGAIHFKLPILPAAASGRARQ
jgi:hypothetical protein